MTKNLDCFSRTLLAITSTLEYSYKAVDLLNWPEFVH